MARKQSFTSAELMRFYSVGQRGPEKQKGLSGNRLGKLRKNIIGGSYLGELIRDLEKSLIEAINIFLGWAAFSARN